MAGPAPAILMALSFGGALVAQVTWHRRVPDHGPSDRPGMAMAYDADRQRIVAFGGGELGAEPDGDTWEWDGTRWQQRSPAHAPSGRERALMVYDRARRRIVLFGGYAPPASLRDTWEWDGTDWVQRPSTNAPLAGDWSAMAYDEARQRVVFFGR